MSAIFIPAQSFALSQQTCIAYMEADAISAENFEAAYKAFDAVENKAAKEFWNDVRSSNMPGWVKWANEHIRKFNSPGFAFKHLNKSDQKSIKHIMDAYLSTTNAADKIYKAKVAEIEKKRTAAYLKAYKGRRSKVDSVMRKLLNTDRQVCRLVYGE